MAYSEDPLTITQNLTLAIPPKTTIGGMIAAILGIDYNDYFNDEQYFNFEYSVVLKKQIRKKSFCQNYIEDYTKKSEIKTNAISDLLLKDIDCKSDNKKTMKLYDDLTGKITKPKPIYRELLIDPVYLIFINKFKYENELVEAMRNHLSAFTLFMGNSEFAANYDYLECLDVKEKKLDSINSFTSLLDKIKFEPERKYSTVYFATKVTGKREYRDYKKLVLCDKPISFKEPIAGYSIKTTKGDYNCEFI